MPFFRSAPSGRRLSSRSPLAVLLLGTFILTGWLGYQAVDAAVSHRNTAEAVLSDYGRIAANEMADHVNREMDDVLDEVFEELRYGRSQRGTWRSPEFLLGEMAQAMREERCACPEFREPLAVFRLSRATGEAEILPDTLPPALVSALLSRLLRAGEEDRDETLFMVPAQAELRRDVMVGYSVAPADQEGDEAVFGFVIGVEALRELLEQWYAEEELLPRPISAGLPNDSLLHVAVSDPRGRTIFSSPPGFPDLRGAVDSVDAALGGFVVEAAVRPDRASQLVIGGLPRSRLPLLTGLMLLTLGVAVAAAVQLRREQRFQRLRDDFVSGVSHELRTPLAQIRMFAELQMDGKLATEEDRVRARSIVYRESVRLSHLVENILQFSRLQRMPEQRLPKAQVNLADALADGIDAVVPLLEDRGMRLRVVREEGVYAVANRDALTRIVVNLVDNAAKYGPKGQVVTVAVESRNGSARLSVTDEGPGVPAADRDRVWKAYRRLERDIKAQIPGTGIGLSVVAELAHLHQGRVWIEDAAPSGARFVVELPLAGDGTREPAAGAAAHA